MLIAIISHEYLWLKLQLYRCPLKSRILVVFPYLSVVFLIKDSRILVVFSCLLGSYFSRFLGIFGSYFYLTTLILHKSLCTEKTLCIKYTLNNINSLHKNTLCTTLHKKRYSTVKKIILNRDAHYIHNRKVSRVEEMSLIYDNKK